MSDLERLESLTGAALRERLLDEHVDLEALVTTSLHRGRRLRRRRRAAAGALVVAAVTVVATAATGTDLVRGSDRAVDPTDAPPPTASAPPTSAPSPTAAPERPVPPASFPVALDLPGWTCEVFAKDEKMACTSEQGGNVSVVLRASADRPEFVAPGGKSDPGVLVSRVHGNFFVTVQGELGATSRQQFAGGLVFGERWDRPD